MLRAVAGGDGGGGRSPVPIVVAGLPLHVRAQRPGAISFVSRGPCTALLPHHGCLLLLHLALQRALLPHHTVTPFLQTHFLAPRTTALLLLCVPLLLHVLAGEDRRMLAVVVHAGELLALPGRLAPVGRRGLRVQRRIRAGRRQLPLLTRVKRLSAGGPRLLGADGSVDGGDSGRRGVGPGNVRGGARRSLSAVRGAALQRGRAVVVAVGQALVARLGHDPASRRLSRRQ